MRNFLKKSAKFIIFVRFSERKNFFARTVQAAREATTHGFNLAPTPSDKPAVLSVPAASDNDSDDVSTKPTLNMYENKP